MQTEMSFHTAKAKVVEAIRNKRFRHEQRKDLVEKNLLATGQVGVEEAIAILNRTRGTEASSSPHHFDASIEVWVFRPAGWYIKFYLVGSCYFISFHRSEGTI
jgi:hypothetical protein